MHVDAPPCLPGRGFNHSFMAGSRICAACWWSMTPLTQPVSRRRRKSALDKVIDYWGSRCVFCRALATTRDHLVPRSRGGLEHLDNLRPCCKPCNAAKADMTPAEWLGEACPAEFAGLVAPRPRPPHEVKRREAMADRARRTKERQRRAELLEALADQAG